MFRIMNPETPHAERGKLRFLLRDLWRFLQQYRHHRRLLRKWHRMTPERQFAFWMSCLASDPALRDAFRRALRVKGIPESQQDDRRVIPADELAARRPRASSTSVIR